MSTDLQKSIRKSLEHHNQWNKQSEYSLYKSYNQQKRQ